MSMTTQCPACGTVFRIVPQQLQAQHGTVRCGRCAQVFDGFKTLATLRDEAPLESGAQSSPQAAAPMPATTPAAVSPSFQPEAQPDIATPSYSPAASSLASPLGADEVLGAEPPRRSRGGWAFGSVLALLALAGQGAYFYRSEIAANVPEARAQLSRMCEILHCAVSLPQRPRQISIEASDMQAVDPANPGVIALTATLRNNATVELGYPALDVILTNSKEHTVARRIFLPTEYLDAARSARAGIPPNAEVTVRLDLDTGDLGAAGFRLDLLAAPAR